MIPAASSSIRAGRRCGDAGLASGHCASEAPGKGMHWGAEAGHQTLPRGFRTNVGTVGSLQEVMFGPSHNADGTTNFVGALRRAMATTGYIDLKSFQRCPVTVASSH